MRYLAGMRNAPSMLTGLLAAPAYLALMLVALGMFILMSRTSRRRRLANKA